MGNTLYDFCMASNNAKLLSQWHPRLNGELTPHMVSAGSAKKVWWRCEKGHEWQAAVYAMSRDRTSGCPVCAGKRVIPGENDLATSFPVVAAQWHPTKNGELTPSDVTPYSNRRVWWICDKGHEYYTRIALRTMENSGCPYCEGKKVLAGFNDLATKFPEIADQWHPDLNGSLTPQMVTPGSHKNVWWRCSEGHAWQSAVYSRTSKRKHGCPVCSGRAKTGR